MKNNTFKNINYYIEVLENFEHSYGLLYPNEDSLSTKDKEQFGILVKFLKKDAIDMLNFWHDKYIEEVEHDVKKYIDDKIWNLAITVNASFKGLLASMGEGGQIAAKAIPIQTILPVNEGKSILIENIATVLEKVNLEDGDVVVLAEKPFPVAERRLIPLEMIMNENDPKRINLEKRRILKEKISQIIGDIVEDEDLILADTYTSDPNLGQKATIGASDHNKLAFECAASIRAHTGKIVDVVISDTDTGSDVRQTIIGCITLAATPVGATKGVNLYECMRAACAAEFVRGSKKSIPIVICKPADRCRKREGIGEYRGYSRKLKFSQEGKIAYD